MFYFSRVFERCGTHPDANATAAYIEHDNGNDTRAAEYMEKSLTGAYSDVRFDFLMMIKPDAKPLADPDKVNMGKEEYFIPNGLAPAPNCTNWNSCEKVTTQQNVVNNRINAAAMKNGDIVLANTLQKILEDPVENANFQSGKGWTPGPFAKKADYLISQLGTLYLTPRQEYGIQMFESIARATELAQQKVTALELEFQPRYKACEGVGGNCSANVTYQYCLRRMALDNEHFLNLSNIAQNYETAWYAKDVKHYNDMVFLRPFVVPNERVRMADDATFANALLNDIRTFTLSTCNPAGKPQCIPPPPPETGQDSNPFFKDGKCLIDVKIPFIVGSMSLNCESFSIEGGEGVTFRYEKNFQSKETTLAVGVGVTADIPGIDAGASVEVGVKFDANNQPIDLIGSAQAGIGLTGMSSPVVAVGASVGINSSFTPSFTAFGR
ncbi:MAG TPA: hypothetical protein VLJ68_10665 [Chitinophagaceae bacterium]|nr:hypothetical protein [Chitinophagaceae bacterium]